MPKKKSSPTKGTLDEEEQDILDSFERGEWKSVDNVKEEIALAKKAAHNFFKKNSGHL